MDQVSFHIMYIISYISSIALNYLDLLINLVPFLLRITCHIKKIRKSALHLQQVIRRTVESRYIISTDIKKNKSKFSIEHSSGPLLENCPNPQFKLFRTDKYCINTSKFADRFVQLLDGSIIEIHNFATCMGSLIIIGNLY